MYFLGICEDGLFLVVIITCIHKPDTLLFLAVDGMRFVNPITVDVDLAHEGSQTPLVFYRANSAEELADSLSLVKFDLNSLESAAVGAVENLINFGCGAFLLNLARLAFAHFI